MTEDDLRWAAGQFRAFMRERARRPLFEKLQVSSWAREPDYSDEYRHLYELEKELSGLPSRRPERGLLSVWRLARDRDYAPWAYDMGVRVCQIKFFGMEQATDWGHRRRGAFRDALVATERLLAAGIRVRWRWYFTKRIIPDLAGLIALAEELRLRERCQALGGPSAIFLHCPSPEGEAFQLEHLRPVERDLDQVPAWLREQSEQHFPRSVSIPERKLVSRFLDEQKPMAASAEDLASGSAGLWFHVDPTFDVYPYMCETTPRYRLGNLKQDGLARCVEVFESDRTPGLRAMFHVPVSEFARRFGRPRGQRLYHPWDLKVRWARMWADEVWAEQGALQ